MIKNYFIAAIVLAATYGCFGSVPSYYSRDNWNTAEEANKILIVKAVNSWRNTSPSQFTMDEWKKLRYDNKITIVDELMQCSKNDRITLTLPSSFYVKELDLIMINLITSKDKESLRNTSIGVTFHALAAMEGDWGNGEEKCEHAKAYLGEPAFADFMHLFPDKYKRLCTDDAEKQIQL